MLAYPQSPDFGRWAVGKAAGIISEYELGFTVLSRRPFPIERWFMA